MSSVGRTLRAYLELSRISNIPTCLTNVLVGCAIAASGEAIPWLPAAGITLAVMLLYVAGMALNDAVDAEVDARLRPERPIPSGRISRRAAFLYAATCLVLGVGITALFGAAALALGVALAASIVVYDIIHRRVAASVVLMGLCRGVIYPLAAAAVSRSVDWNVVGWLAGTLALYIILMTFVARKEAVVQAGARRWLSAAFPMIVLAPAATLRPQQGIWSIVAAVALIAWLGWAAGRVFVRPSEIGRAVHAWLAGICLIDAFFLTLLDQPAAALICLGCFCLTAVGHRYILGT
ncbi:MAG: UbiA family prenyltransferase [Planctomycetes bacterium]|nr:UbiA family prenyltransferase [Planctomycetota bacterium]